MLRVLSIVDALLLLLLCVATAHSSLHRGYCTTYPKGRREVMCCAGRNDTCAVRYFDTLCYCDFFCDRARPDCCPDFIAHCLREPLVTTERPLPPPTRISLLPTTRIPLTPTTERPLLPTTRIPLTPTTRILLPPTTRIPLPQPTTYRPPTNVQNNSYCHHEKRIYDVGDRITVNCNSCTCLSIMINDEFDCKRRQKIWKCAQEICLIRPELINYVNCNVTKYGWTASNYSFFWGLTLDEGMKRRLGTRRPSAHITTMSVLKITPDDNLSVEFDARKEWPGLISPVLDQMDCGSSWAFSTAGVASDRLRIHSNGVYNRTLSPQHLISCNTDHGQHGCESGHVDRAWWFIRKVGIVTDDCFHYTSGVTRKTEKCPLPKSFYSLKKWACPEEKTPIQVYQATPPYKISTNEKEIMKEIIKNGPLQVVMEVKEDFYMYRSGVYHHSLPADYLPPSQRQTNFHSVRLIGWGVDKSTGHPRKYWLCANSWGRDWGEDGYFRILRGTGESSVESYVIGAWMKIGHRTLVRSRDPRR